ncbi:sensor histidine kinase [Marinifilum sp. RC60d5]|uniref:sensor histidine kinase n=1 Tax=Marinifilum sp. RC60d5 TaxID=3458414 RepID=UPI004036BC5E
MNLDYPTILFFFVITNIFNLALFTYQYFFHHKKWYLSVFIMGILFQTIAMILIGFRKNLPFIITVQLSNFFLISSFALTSFGLISYDNKIRKNIFWLFSIFTLIFYCSFLLVAEDDIKRIIIQIIACSFFYGISAYILFTNKEKYKFSLIIGSALISYSIFQLYRANILYQVEQPYHFLEGSTIDNWYLVISVFIVSTLRIGYIMLLKEIDENIIILKNKIIETDKLKLEELNNTKDKLFSIIAHDLRSPFNSIIGFSDLLNDNIKTLKTEKTKEYLSFINSAAKNTLTLLDNLLNWAKSQTGQINFNQKQIILTLIIGEIIELSNSTAAAKKIALTKNSIDDIKVYADEEMLRIILRNLVSNAIKFTNTGGNISILTKKEKLQIEIAVSDNGVGMNNDTKNKLFKLETNVSTIGTANEKGSGLGLILCKEFIEKHGGKIWVESKLGKGSVFKFTLPLVKEV